MRKLYNIAEFILNNHIIAAICGGVCVVSGFIALGFGTKYVLYVIGFWMLILFILGIISFIGERKYRKES